VKQYLKLRSHHQVDVWPRGKPKLFIFRNCVNMIREIKSYRWKPQTESGEQVDKPVKKNDHAMDELKYYIMSRPEIELSDPIDTVRRSQLALNQSNLPHALQSEQQSGSFLDY
jgi:hypothetical protein